jgi:hypothetical protein
MYSYRNGCACANNSSLAPGLKVATASKISGEKSNYIFSRGTSNATALVTRNAVKIFEALKGLDDDRIKEEYFPVLIKTLLVHGARWNESEQFIEKNLKEKGDKIFKKELTRYLGFGVPNFGKVISCTEQRATIIGFGTIHDKKTHEFKIPIPQCISGERELRRVVITLSYITPVSSTNRKYRIANLSFTMTVKTIKEETGANDGKSVYHHINGNGTVQHVIFEGKQLKQVQEDDCIILPISCREDIPSIPGDGIRYGIAVTFEVSENINLPVYEQIKNKLKIAVPVRG